MDLRWEMLHEMGDATQDGRCHRVPRWEMLHVPQMGDTTVS